MTSWLSPHSVDLIAPGIYVGNYASASDRTFLQTSGITLVLNCTREVPVPAELYKNLGIEAYRLPLVDSTSDEAQVAMHDVVDRAVELMREHIARGGNVLVHCFAGVQRSATIVLAYLMRLHPTWPVHKLMGLMRMRRPIVFQPYASFARFIREHDAKRRYDRVPRPQMPPVAPRPTVIKAKN